MWRLSILAQVLPIRKLHKSTIVAYGMVPAGDEITESLSDHYLLLPNC